MGLVINDTRQSSSPHVEAVMQGHTVDLGSLTRPAETRWHMVLSKRPDKTEFLLVGPWSSAGIVEFSPDAEILWIRFNRGVYMPHIPPKSLVDAETALPLAAQEKFWLKGEAWSFPDYQNVDTFVQRLIREDLLRLDPVVDASLKGHPIHVAPRTVRHHFLHTVGLSLKRLRQIERAHAAASMLQRGETILDTVTELEYYDQSHLTNSLKRFLGYTPSQLNKP